jgi:hypothetical protein
MQRGKRQKMYNRSLENFDVERALLLEKPLRQRLDVTETYALREMLEDGVVDPQDEAMLMEVEGQAFVFVTKQVIHHGVIQVHQLWAFGEVSNLLFSLSNSTHNYHISFNRPSRKALINNSRSTICDWILRPRSASRTRKRSTFDSRIFVRGAFSWVPSTAFCTDSK